MDARVLLRAVAAVVAAVVTSACDGGSPTPPAPVAPPPVPGATQVTGRERLAWLQSGDGTALSFRAYVDGVAVDLGAADCVVGGMESQCSAPLPAMSDGVHTLQLVAVSPSYGEGERSETITLQKVPARTTQAASALPDATGASSSDARSDKPASAADVIARDVRMPAQLAALPDGRLLVAEAGGRVRVVHLEAPSAPVVALEAGALLDPAPAGALAIAAHPDFATTHHAFVADIYRAEPDRLRLRVVRMREVGDRLGEPATIFETAVTAQQPSDGGEPVRTPPELAGPRLAFGAEGLLYVALPPGLVFDNEPAASRPVAAVVRLTAEGGRPADGALQGVTAHPLAFAWHPVSGELIGLVSDGQAGATLRGLAVPADALVPGVAGPTRFHVDRERMVPLLRIDALTAAAVIGTAAVAPSAASAPSAATAARWPQAVRLAMPADLDALMPGVTGHLSDLVTQGGAVFGVVSDAAPRDGVDPPLGLIVRFRP